MSGTSLLSLSTSTVRVQPNTQSAQVQAGTQRQAFSARTRITRMVILNLGNLILVFLGNEDDKANKKLESYQFHNFTVPLRS